MSDFNEMATEIGRLEPDDVSKGAQLAGAMFDQYIADKIRSITKSKMKEQESDEPRVLSGAEAREGVESLERGSINDPEIDYSIYDQGVIREENPLMGKKDLNYINPKIDNPEELYNKMNKKDLNYTNPEIDESKLKNPEELYNKMDKKDLNYTNPKIDKSKLKNPEELYNKINKKDLNYTNPEDTQAKQNQDIGDSDRDDR